MDKKIAGLLGAVAALGTVSSAQAAPAPTEALQANSYAELLQPIPNAAALLQAMDEQQTKGDEARVQLAQYHHHHHHHHHHYRRPGIVIVPPHVRLGHYHHHHHHHHHHHNGY